MHKFDVGDKVRLTKSTLQTWLASGVYTDIIKTEALIEAMTYSLYEDGIYRYNYRLLFPSPIYKNDPDIEETGFVSEDKLENSLVTLWDI